jgi:hypothetical protein
MPRFAMPIAAALVLAAPIQAQEQGAIALEPGDAVSLRVDASGAVAVSPREPASWTAFDVAAARHLSGLPVPKAAVPYGAPLPDNGTIPAPDPIEPGMIRVKFLSIAGRHSLLVLQNGYDQAIVYRARMTHGGRTTPTDVCLVIPHRHGFEHWAFLIDRLEIYDLRFVAWRAGDPVPCA